MDIEQLGRFSVTPLSKLQRPSNDLLLGVINSDAKTRERHVPCWC
jgi:hypothetical protein